MRSSASLAWGIFAPALLAEAQFLIGDLSFGHDGRIAPEHARSIPGFDLLGSPRPPEILSNKLILTPAAPAPGNQRGAVWAQKPLEHVEWMADIDLRVSGPDRGSGNVNIWLARNGHATVGTSSARTVGAFEGLVLVLESASPSSVGGSLRGYLNDGSKTFHTQTALDGLSFGHCDYAYRNLGRPSQIKIRQTSKAFEVQVDGRSCFATDQVSIPAGYHFGVTAASAEIPDSAEIFKFVLTTETSPGGLSHDQSQSQGQSQGQGQSQNTGQTPLFNAGRTGRVAGSGEDEFRDEDMADADPNSIVSSKAQFADLHNRLQTVNHHLSTIFRHIARTDTIGEKRHEEISIQLGELKGLLSRLDKLDILDKLHKLEKLDKIERLDMVEDKLEQMERSMKSLHSELRHSITSTEQTLKNHVTGNLAGHHSRLADELRHPGHRRLIFVIVGGQVFLAVSYFVYKHRKAQSYKKFL